MSGVCILLTAVEASADELAAALIPALRDRLGPTTRFIGVGGPAMLRAGLTSAFDPSMMAVVGAANALGAYPMVRRRVREVAALARRERPDVAVLIDSWGFSIRLAKALRAAAPSLLLIKYIAPQVWATRPGRARTLAGAVDRLLTIHAFDSPWFEAQGLATDFVGNPALSPARTGTLPVREPNTLLVLPGSRRGEVRRLMPAFGDAVQRLSAERPTLQVVIALAPAVAEEVERLAALWPRRADSIISDERDRAEAMSRATVALACSGTVTTQLAQAGCPMVVAYRLDLVTYMIAKRLIRSRYITLFNVAAASFVAPERVQAECNGSSLAADLATLLDDPARRSAQSQAQLAAIELMRSGIADPIASAADAIVAAMKSQPRSSTGV